MAFRGSEFSLKTQQDLNYFYIRQNLYILIHRIDNNRYASAQSFINDGTKTLLNFDWMVQTTRALTFQPIILIFRKVNLVYHH